jgi:DNA-binding GntR family transcriptional regulator
MDFDVMRGFFQTAPMIYASMARLAAERASPDQVATLRAIQDDFRTAVERNEPGEMVLHNHRLHEMIGFVADNPYLMPSLQRLLIDHTRMSQTFYRPRFTDEAGRIEAACAQHDALIDAVEAHEPARAVEITMAHWALSRDRIELYVAI